jgi:hypothetical protein
MVVAKVEEGGAKEERGGVARGGGCGSDEREIIHRGSAHCILALVAGIDHLDSRQRPAW